MWGHRRVSKVRQGVRAYFHRNLKFLGLFLAGGSSVGK